MATLQFEFEIDPTNDEPDRHIIELNAKIYEYILNEAAGDGEEQVGSLRLTWVQRARIVDDGTSLFEAMDCHSSESCECFEQLFEHSTEDWKEQVESMYEPEIIFNPDLLIIRTLSLKRRWRGKGLGAEVIQELIKLLGPSVGLIVCKPFPLQYQGFMGTEGEAHVESKEHETKRLMALDKVRAFWKSSGFRHVRGSEYFVYSEEYDNSRRARGLHISRG